MKKLNQELLGRMELNSADMKEVKGGTKIIDKCYSGQGPTGSGGIATEWCLVYDDGSSRMVYIVT